MQQQQQLLVWRMAYLVPGAWYVTARSCSHLTQDRAWSLDNEQRPRGCATSPCTRVAHTSTASIPVQYTYSRSSLELGIYSIQWVVVVDVGVRTATAVVNQVQYTWYIPVFVFLMTVTWLLCYI